MKFNIAIWFINKTHKRDIPEIPFMYANAHFCVQKTDQIHSNKISLQKKSTKKYEFEKHPGPIKSKGFAKWGKL